VQPGAEPGQVGQPWQAEESLHGGLLGDVVGVRAGAEQPPAQPQHARLPARKQGAERLTVAGRYRRDQFSGSAAIPVHHVILLP
jgi:hypothetical protein